MTTPSGPSRRSTRGAGDDPFPAPIPLIGLFWCVAIAMFVAAGLAIYDRNVRHEHLADFGRIYYAVLEWRSGAGLYQPNLATAAVFEGTSYDLPNVASPTWHLIVWPFTFLRPGAAFILWVLCNVAAWTSSLRLCQKEWGLTISPVLYPVIAIAMLNATVALVAFGTGQYVGLLMIPATLAWRAGRRGQWVASGGWLGLLSSQKPFVVLFIAWLLWHRRWRAVGAALLVVLVSVVCGELVFGRGIHQQWRQALSHDVSAWTWLYINASVWAPWARTFSPSPSFAHAANSTVAVMAGLGCAVAIAGVTAWRLRRLEDVDLGWTVLWSAALLISPLAWTYYFWWAIGPWGGLALRSWTHKPSARYFIIAVGGCLMLPLRTVVLGQPSMLASFTVGSLFTWVLCAIWVCAMGMIPRRVPAARRVNAAGS